MSRRVFIFWSLFATVALGRLVGSFYGSVPDATSCLKHFAVGEGVVDADPERKETGQVLVVRLTRLQTLDASSTALWSKADQVQRREIFRNVSQQPSCVRNILIRIKTDFYPPWAYGDRILIAGTLARPFNFASDGGRSFDYRGYLAKDDIFYEMKSADVSLSGKESLDLTALLFKLKKSFVTHLERSLGEPQAALAAGLVVGEKSALGADLLGGPHDPAGRIHPQDHRLHPAVFLERPELPDRVGAVDDDPLDLDDADAVARSQVVPVPEERGGNQNAREEKKEHPAHADRRPDPPPVFHATSIFFLSLKFHGVITYKNQ